MGRGACLGLDSLIDGRRASWRLSELERRESKEKTAAGKLQLIIFHLQPLSLETFQGARWVGWFVETLKAIMVAT